MTTVHSQKSFFAGDQWEIRGRLFDRNKLPLDIAGATLEWALLDSADVEVISADAAVYTINLPGGLSDGTFTIVVPKEVTALPAGSYNDGLRVSSLTIPRETLWYGPIIVKQFL